MTKARTQAEKRRAKRGRPWLPATDRQPNGQPSRRVLSLKAAGEQSEAETKSVAVEARHRVYGMGTDEPEGGYVLGRLYLSRQLTKRQLEAGNRLAEAFSRYYGLVGIPMPSARAQDLFRVKGAGGESSGFAAKAAANTVMKLEQTLGAVDVDGRHVTSIVKRVCIQDDDSGLSHPYTFMLLARGLNALVEHFCI